MKEKVIFDTNTVRNADANSFLGGRNELELFLKDADIVIPQTVIEEISYQKKKKLKSNKDSFLSNPFHKLLNISEEDTRGFSIEDYISKLADDETIPFETIDLKNNDVLPKIRELALKKEPPFEAKDNTDKGFKDALIYFSVLEYLQEIPNKYVFVCVKDGRLKEAFNKHPNIIVVENYDEFKQKSITQFYDDYFIEKVNDELGITITKENIVEHWDNINQNKNVLINFNDEEYIIETDSGEIISSEKKDTFSELINQFINSPNFATTHNSIEQLMPYMNFLSNEEISTIFNATYENSQIKWIVEDEDVKEFIGILYSSKKELAQGEVAKFLNENFG